MLFLLLALASPPSTPDVLRLSGVCGYPATLPPVQPGEVRMSCDTVKIADGAIVFSRTKGPGRTLRFDGTAAGQDMTVSRVTLGDDARDATGRCEIVRRGGRVAIVSCVAHAGGHAYVANFLPSRL